MPGHGDESVFLRFEAGQQEETSSVAAGDSIIVRVENDFLTDSVGRTVCPFPAPCFHLRNSIAQWWSPTFAWLSSSLSIYLLNVQALPETTALPVEIQRVNKANLALCGILQP